MGACLKGSIRVFSILFYSIFFYFVPVPFLPALNILFYSIFVLIPTHVIITPEDRHHQNINIALATTKTLHPFLSHFRLPSTS